MMKKLQSRMRISSAAASGGLISIGAIGLERTFTSYGVINVTPFALYLAAALMFLLLGIVLGIQVIRMNQVLSEDFSEQKEHVDSNVAKLPSEHSNYHKRFGDYPNFYGLEWRLKAKPPATSVLIAPDGKCYMKEADILKEEDDEKQD